MIPGKIFQINISSAPHKKFWRYGPFGNSPYTQVCYSWCLLEEKNFCNLLEENFSQSQPLNKL